LAQYLPVFESGDDVFGTGTESGVCPVVVVADDPASYFAARGGDRRDAAVSAVAENNAAIEQFGTVWQATMTWLRLPGQHWLATRTRRGERR
jgi:hypothetical protein